MKVEYKVDDGRVKAAFRRAPHIMYRELNKGLDSAATRMVRAAQRRLRKNDSLAFSTLVDAIRYKRTGDLERTVWPDTDYARYLEEGTKPGYFPNGYALTAWLKARGAENPKCRASLWPNIFSNTAPRRARFFNRLLNRLSRP